jgi:hypothetical protein
MLRLTAKRGITECDGLSRREFLRVGALSAGTVGLSLADWTQLAQGRTPQGETSCILLFLVGGPSQLDTWDLKPHAPQGIRGPFRPIRTKVPGIQICEHFPLMAQRADRFALVRSVHHREAPIHETGHQLMQTGYLSRGGIEYPHYGAALSYLRGPTGEGVPTSVVLPRPIGHTGVSVSHGQGAGYLGSQHEPVAPGPGVAEFELEIANCDAPEGLNPKLTEAVDGAECAYDGSLPSLPSNPVRDGTYRQIFSAQAKRSFSLASEKEALRDRYGRNTFGQSCLLARRLVESGVRLVTVNMFETVFNAVTWDCHADGGSLASTLQDYQETLCPMFDAAYTALLDDLEERGLLANTLVVGMGEFGRTPHLNPRGGRDHWPGCWSILFAGGAVRGGQVIGASDAMGGEPSDRPVTPAEVAASVYRGLGIDLSSRLPGPEGYSLPLVDAPPIAELF